MPLANILIQFDTDPQPSVFDSVVAVDSNVAQLFRHGDVTTSNVRNLVYGAIFTRGPQDLKSTAIFVGGSNVAAGEDLLKAIKATFFGPMRVSVMIDSNGANTTAAAAVLAAEKHVPLAGAKALILGGTGPVGQRAARLLARGGATVHVGSRSIERARDVCHTIGLSIPGSTCAPFATNTMAEVAQALDDVQILIAAGTTGVELIDLATRKAAAGLKVAVDLNAVPPVGIAGVEIGDKAKERDGVIAYGAIGVGGTKMKIHKAAVAKLFESNDRVLDAEEIYAIGKELLGQ